MTTGDTLFNIVTGFAIVAVIAIGALLVAALIKYLRAK